jgi:2-polyprenyl-3-methyl-5-hydroxy-6-metoxy-1,4-benzoquinol methylase
MAREGSYGQGGLSPADRFGQWLSLRRVRRELGPIHGQRLADVGCGYQARLAQAFLDSCAAMTLVDLKLDPALKRHPKVQAIEGRLPQVLGRLKAGTFDAVLLNSVLEHLEEPLKTLKALQRALKPGGRLWVNVPNWRGKAALEFSAFKLGLSPAEEMEDHKMYYTPWQLWPLLTAAGFRPSGIRLGTHKLGLNTWALCRKAPA